jgi:hypothetical protein
MKKFTILAGASLLAIAGSAFAEQSLTDAQMDGVSAGAVVFLQGAAGSNAYGNIVANLLGNTSSDTTALADPTAALSGIQQAHAFGINTSVGTSVFGVTADANGNPVVIGGVWAQSSTQAAASLQ